MRLFLDSIAVYTVWGFSFFVFVKLLESWESFVTEFGGESFAGGFESTSDAE
jgi:hypothetical protein